MPVRNREVAVATECRFSPQQDSNECHLVSCVLALVVEAIVVNLCPRALTEPRQLVGEKQGKRRVQFPRQMRGMLEYPKFGCPFWPEPHSRTAPGVAARQAASM
jgi:hypothetical protein